jgi:hypothetical protein
MNAHFGVISIPIYKIMGPGISNLSATRFPKRSRYPSTKEHVIDAVGEKHVWTGLGLVWIPEVRNYIGILFYPVDAID